MSSNSEKDAVVATVQNYLKGLSSVEGSKERLECAFYSSTNLHSVDEHGNLKFQPRDWLVQNVAAGNVHEHKSQILEADVTNDMAFVKVHLDFPDRDFYDYLTLLKLKAGWRIVSKTYTTAMK